MQHIPKACTWCSLSFCLSPLWWVVIRHIMPIVWITHDIVSGINWVCALLRCMTPRILILSTIGTVLIPTWIFVSGGVSHVYALRVEGARVCQVNSWVRLQAPPRKPPLHQFFRFVLLGRCYGSEQDVAPRHQRVIPPAIDHWPLRFVELRKWISVPFARFRRVKVRASSVGFASARWT